MNTSRRGMIVLCGFALFAPGCILPFGPMDMEVAVSKATHAKLTPQITLTTPGLTLVAANLVTRLPVPVEHIGWISFGVYQIDRERHPTICFDELELPGWERVVRVRSDGDDVLIMAKYGSDGESLKGIAMIVADGNNLVMAKLTGRLHKLIEGLFEQDGMLAGLSGTVPMALGRTDAEDIGEPDPVQ